jgi:hypothetical protein
MNQKAARIVVLSVCFAAFALVAPSLCNALETLKMGDNAEFTVYGFVRNNVGMFFETQPFQQNGNQLATCRTWLRTYGDMKFNQQLRFFVATQFVHEPWYPVDEGSNSSRVPTQFGEKTLHDGHEYSEWDNINDVVREVYMEWKPGSTHSIRIGRQIAIWGEALTTRVGDVIHPDDNRFAFTFANLEDTRIPSWMIRGIHEIPSLLSSFEWIYNPNIVQNKYTVTRSATQSSGGNPGQRFGVNPETRFDPPYSVKAPGALPDVVIPSPISRDWVAIPGGSYIPLAIPSVKEEYPEGWGEDSRYGFRTTTSLGGFTFGASYFHTQNYDPVIRRDEIIQVTPGAAPDVRRFTLTHPTIDIIGAYMNKQLTGSAPIPGVLRIEGIYIPNKPFGTFDLGQFDAVVRRDYVKYLVGYDLNGFFYPQWHKTASFDVTFEHVGEWIPNNSQLRYVNYDTELKQWNPSFAVNISTTWRYGQIYTGVIASYFPWGDSGIVMPSVKYMPPWLNKQFSAELRYIGIYGNSDFEGLGLLRRKDMIVLTTQLNF